MRSKAQGASYLSSMNQKIIKAKYESISDHNIEPESQEIAENAEKKSKTDNLTT